MDLLALFVLIVTLILINAFFVASEYALVSIRRTRVDELVKKREISALAIRKALNHIDHYISAIQLGITLASILLGWLGEPGFVSIFEGIFSIFHIPTSSFPLHVVTSIVAFLIITFLDIVFGELVPKNIALQQPEWVASIIITPLMMFANIFMPFIKLLTFCSMQIVRLFGFSKHTKKPGTHSEDEIKIILSQSAQSGEIEKEEAEMVYKIFRMGDLPVVKTMIPKKHVVAFEASLTLEKIAKELQKNSHSRFPIYHDTLDNIIGFIHVKDVYKALVSGKGEKKLEDTQIMREIIKISEHKLVDDLIIQMQKRRIHLALVENERGETIGIVTLEDLLENIVGEIHDEFERPGVR